MRKEQNFKAKIPTIIVGLLTAAIIVVVIIGAANMMNPHDYNSGTYQVQTGETEQSMLPQIVEVERTIDAEVIEDGLRDMGFLVTEEYYFTEVINQSKAKTVFGIDIPFSRIGYCCSYDGTIEAGVDFEKIKVEKDDDAKMITITLPLAEILSVDVDPESFVSYSETTSWLTQFTSDEYNDGLVELEAEAKDKAIDKGLLTTASDHAKSVIQNFVGSLVDTQEYRVIINTEEE